MGHFILRHVSLDPDDWVHPHGVNLCWQSNGANDKIPVDSAYYYRINETTGSKDLQPEIHDWLVHNYPNQWLWHRSSLCLSFRERDQALMFITMWAGYAG